jgi:galactokinase
MPERAFRAPARVNLIGGQVDYHEGIVVGMAIDRDVVVRATARGDGRIVARSSAFDGIVDAAADASDDLTAFEPKWGRPIVGVARVLGELGRAPIGAELRIASTVPLGAGLSSSAAFEVAVTLALADAAGMALGPLDLARTAQSAEHVALGVPCGIQDQLTSITGRPGHAVRLDCRTLTAEPLPLPPELGLVVVHSGVARTLEGSPWLTRRAESFDTAAQLGLSVLRDARAEQVADLPRGRHVVSEIARAAAFADALRAGDVDALGPLLLASHASSRDDMQVSIPELDALVDALVAGGALGARLTGGGFGGCVVALVPADDASEIAARAAAEYGRRTGRVPTPWVVQAASGAGQVAASC